jgi:hypothetical protein
VVSVCLLCPYMQKGNKLRSDYSKESGSCLYRNKVNLDYYYGYSTKVLFQECLNSQHMHIQ